MNIWLTIPTSLISGIIGVILTLAFQRRSEIRRQKIEVLRELSGYRFTLISSGVGAQPSDKARFQSALNQIFIIYADDKNVMRALEEFHTSVVGKQAGSIINDALVKLFKTMAKSARVDISQLNDSFFLTPFH